MVMIWYDNDDDVVIDDDDNDDDYGGEDVDNNVRHISFSRLSFFMMN